MLTGLPDAGQWKMLYETEKSRADLQASMQTMCTDHRTQLENMAEEIKVVSSASHAVVDITHEFGVFGKQGTLK